MVFFRFLPILFCKWSFFAHISNLFRHDFFPEKGHTENSGRRRMASHLFLIDICLIPIALALGSLAIVKVSGRPPLLAFLRADSAGLEKGSPGSVEGSPNFSSHLSPSLLLKRFCGRSPQLFFAFVSQSSLVMWKVPLTLLYICLPIFSSKKVLWKVPPNFFVSFGVFSHSKGVLCSKSKASHKVLWGVPQTSLYICLTVSRFFLANGCCFRKGSVEGSAN